MAASKAGGRVRIIERPVTNEDVKSGLYYSYFGGLTGTVDRQYDDGSVCVDVELESLTDEMRARHLSVQESERKRWLDGLSDEGRNRLSAEQKQLKMSYRILVSKNDIEPAKGDAPGGKPALQAKKAESGAAKSTEEGAGDSTDDSQPSQAARGSPETAQPKPRKAEAEPAPKRLSEADLAAAEEEFLRSRQSNA